MRFQSICLMLFSMACAWGTGMMVPGNLKAEEAHTSPTPIPEGTPVQHNCPYCQNGNADLSAYGGYCPSCRRAGRRGYGYGYNGNRRQHPGEGWCPPAKVTQQRVYSEYWKWYPNYWSGRGPGPALPYYPAVYTPTDTTHLGAYYERVPPWTAQPGRVPGPPHPATWHHRYCNQCRGLFGRPRNPGHGTHYNPYYGVPATAEQSEDSAENNEEESSPTPAVEEPQTIILPEPSFVPRTPRISVLPDAPPEA